MTLEVGFVLEGIVIDGWVVWTIFMVLFVGWFVESGIEVADGLFATGFFFWVVDSVVTSDVGLILMDVAIDGWVVLLIVGAVECVTPKENH